MNPEYVAPFNEDVNQKRRADWTCLEATRAKREPQSKRIFDNVCHELLDPPGSITPEQHRERFVARLADGAKRHIDDLNVLGPTNQQLYQAIWARMAAYIARYQGRHNFEKKRDHVVTLFRRLTGHVDALVGQEIVDVRTAQVFLSALPSMNYLGDYNAVIRNRTDISSESLRAKSQPYLEALEEIWARYSDETKQRLGDFVHFNSHLGRRVKNRVYISARLAGAPDKVIEAWQASLQETGLQDKVYFKLPAALSNRFETIILFQSDKTHDADIEILVTAFATNCSRDLLSERDMPTGVPIRRGISIAPEPATINTFTRYSGSRERISYNQFIAGVSELAFELAYKDAQTLRVARPTLQRLKEEAGTYFEGMIRLAEINPDTMVPSLNGGRWPAWVENILEDAKGADTSKIKASSCPLPTDDG